jgi:hypothetical protein
MKAKIKKAEYLPLKGQDDLTLDEAMAQHGYKKVETNETTAVQTVEHSTQKRRQLEGIVVYGVDYTNKALKELASMVSNGMVLQYCAAGWFVQVQIVEDTGSAGGIKKMSWQPITGIHSEPMAALKEAKSKPFGRLTAEPPSAPPSETPGMAPSKPGETQDEGSVGSESSDTPDPPQKPSNGREKAKPSGKNDEKPAPKQAGSPLPPFVIRVYDTTAPEVTLIPVIVNNRKGNWLFTRSEKHGGLPFNLKTGLSKNELFKIPPVSIDKIMAETEVLENPTLAIDTKAEPVLIGIPAHEPGKESTDELTGRLKAMLGLTVMAERMHRTPTAIGEVGGVYSQQKDGKELKHCVNIGSLEKPRFITVKPESIREA